MKGFHPNSCQPLNLYIANTIWLDLNAGNLDIVAQSCLPFWMNWSSLCWICVQTFELESIGVTAKAVKSGWAYLLNISKWFWSLRLTSKTKSKLLDVLLSGNGNNKCCRLLESFFSAPGWKDKVLWISVGILSKITLPLSLCCLHLLKYH